MVDDAYLLEKPSGPSAAKRFLDQVVLPIAIDAAGAGEDAVQRLSQRTGLRPVVIVAGVAAGTLLLLAAARPPRRPHRPGPRPAVS